jgi:hypothetical protein
MVMQEEHKVYPGLGHELRNTLHPMSLWIVLMYDNEAPSFAIRQPPAPLQGDPNSVAGPLRSFATDLVPSSVVDNKGIKLMHTDRSAT